MASVLFPFLVPNSQACVSHLRYSRFKETGCISRQGQAVDDASGLEVAILMSTPWACAGPTVVLGYSSYHLVQGSISNCKQR